MQLCHRNATIFEDFNRLKRTSEEFSPKPRKTLNEMINSKGKITIQKPSIIKFLYISKYILDKLSETNSFFKFVESTFSQVLVHNITD